MKNNIIQYVKENNQASFVELKKAILGFSGDEVFCLYGYPNIVLWVGISQKAINALEELINDHQLYMQHSNPLIYMLDGKGLNLPIAKSIRNYKDKRWLPVVFTNKSNR